VESLVAKASIVTLFLWRRGGGTVAFAARLGFIGEPEQVERLDALYDLIQDKKKVRGCLQTLEHWHHEDSTWDKILVRSYRLVFFHVFHCFWHTLRSRVFDRK